jgi:nitrogen regulatory protein P-II 1
MKLVAAIIRTASLERVVQALEHIGIKGMTIYEIKGLGEEVQLNNPYTIHDKIEVIVSDQQADAVEKSILDHTRTGLAGDGVVTVTPLDYAVTIRTEERLLCMHWKEYNRRGRAWKKPCFFPANR